MCRSAKDEEVHRFNYRTHVLGVNVPDFLAMHKERVYEESLFIPVNTSNKFENMKVINYL
jgi:hypothetical protein